MLTTSLQISRAEAGIGRDRFRREDIAGLIRSVAELYQPSAEDSAIKLVCDAEEDLFAPVHRELLSQAIGNLIENALRYATGARTITLSAERDERMIWIGVADDGPGISADRRGEALRRFGRLDPSRNLPGSGLGLSLAAATANLHSGTLSLEDGEPGLRVVLTIAASSDAGN